MRDRTSVSRLWLRVPTCEWAAVKHGVKTEFRGFRALSLANVEKPTPVLLFKRTNVILEMRMAILLEAWSEPLGAISDESLRNEGVDTVAEFKMRWTAHRDRRFDPLKKAYVYRVRLWQPADEREWADKLFKKLYPEALR